MRNFYHDTRRVASQGLGGTFSPWGKTGPAGHQPSISKSQKHLFQYSATYSKIQLLDCTNLAINCKNGNGVKISDMMSWSNFFDVVLLLLSSLVTDLSFMSISSLVLELWQFHFIRDWPENRNIPIRVLPNICRLGGVRDTKFDTKVCNKMLVNAAKCQGYSFYCFWVIKGKPTRGGG